MNDSFIPPRSIRIEVERRYYVTVGFDGSIIAGQPAKGQAAA